MTARPGRPRADGLRCRKWRRAGYGHSDRRRVVRRGMAGAALVGLMAVSTSCATGHSELGTDDGPCFVALPAAYGAVHHRGALLGVRLVPWSALGRFAVRVQARLDGHHPPGRVCVVAFSGAFRRNQVERPAGAEVGPLAVVVLRYPSAALVATLIAHHRPLAFGHPYLISTGAPAPTTAVSGPSGRLGPPARADVPRPPR